ncbi:hypothetical protein KUTeg_023496 [Tegillarca granosa]|uniref:Uncharacterized protein n=1 Tax=Tegillarca granosa TaxID=220873 RepID=A0ABQ9E1T2_TEGGR|nr:hypothetical protein KUTeg_023496 [Tegillarca granosa]
MSAWFNSAFSRLVTICRVSEGFINRKIGLKNKKFFARMTDQKKSSVTIGTHNGSFHCDEVFACYMLKLLPKYKNAEIIRTRDPAVIDKMDIVVDVGGTFDPQKNRFDHHQRTFTDTMNSLNPKKKWTIRLSSAGLVYYHFGKEIVARILELPESDPITDIIYDKVYENFVQEIDAIDNGVNQHDEEPRVAYLNQKWNETDKDEQALFYQAMEMVGAEFMDRVLYYKQSWLPARDLVETAIKNRHQADPSGEIVVLESCGCPWRDHLFNIEEELKLDVPIKYILYQDNNKKWRVQCVPIRIGSFENRLSLPEEWRGLRDDALSQKSGIPGCVFVHASGFIGGNDTYEGALKMAQISLQQQAKNGV